MAAGDWEVLPFYYSLGAWPRNYGGKPVFYSLPYEKGPPKLFAGHIIARWDSPAVRVTFEGPKTPQAGSHGERTARAEIRQCLVGAEKSWSCLKIREITLMRPLEEMQKQLAGEAGGNTALKMQWKLRWFVVRNAAIAPADQAQGIYISAQDEAHGRGQERYILVTENGTHQAVILDYPLPSAADTPESPTTRAAELARSTFGNAVRSLRAADDLAPGRAWIDRQLQAIQLKGMGINMDPNAKSDLNPESVARLSAVQASLLAKISVEPGSFEAYYHLGGTALLLSRYARQAGQGALETGAVAKPLIASAYSFAQDLAPKDPRTTQLQGFWLESKKP
jgi:hypothetical protein